MLKRAGAIPIVVCVLAAACAGPQAGVRPTSPDASPSSPKHLVAAIMVEPPALYRPLIPGSFVIQTGDLADAIVNVGLTMLDSQGLRQPIIADAVPSLGNGQWKVSPDGRMELVWKIRTGAEWHDGSALTADDLVFSVRASQDPALPEFRAGLGGAFDLIDQVQAVDAHTVSVTWKKPFIRADRVFSTGSEGVAQPLPRHLLESAYVEGRESFLQAGYWSREYVGLGPYKLREWVVGSHLMLDANPRYVLGRPKIDEMEVRFVLDANTVNANLLAGALQVTLGIGLSLEQSLEIRDQWREGELKVAYVSYWINILPQFVNPNPPIVLDVRFRRALLQAIDRQAMADTIMAGLVPVAHSYVKPDDPEYAETERFLTRYEYDPRRAAQGLEELGYAQGPDGTFRDASGQRLDLQVRATTSPAIHQKAMLPVADYWQRLGLAVEPYVVPVQQGANPEFRATFPAFEVVRRPSGPSYVERLHGSESPLPHNRFQGRNTSRYMNPEFDGLIDRYLSTISWEPRMLLLGQIVGHISDQLPGMGLFYDVGTTLVSHRLLNVPAQNPTANVQEWDLKS